MIVYKVVCEYVRVNKEKLKQEEINELFETVRFPFLTFGKNLSSLSILLDIQWHSGFPQLK